jgi:type II secretory pathway pseudopilin PulG
MNMSKERRRKGFTLIESLLVGIIGIALTGGMTIAVVSYLNSTTRGIAEVEVQTQLRSALDYIAQDLKEARYIYRRPTTECNTQVGNTNNTCAVDIRSSVYNLPTNIGGAATITPLLPSNFGSTGAPEIIVAFWVRFKKGMLGYTSASICSQTAAYTALSDGELLSTVTTAPPTPTQPYNCSPYGTALTSPAYVLVVYYTRQIDTASTTRYIGPRLLYRWTSPPVGIPLTNFGQGLVATGTADLVTPKGFVSAPPQPTSADITNKYPVADYIPDSATALEVRSIDPLNGQTYELILRGTLTSAFGTTQAQSTQSSTNVLEYRTVVVARNVCSGGTGDTATCSPDPSN